MKQPDLLQHPEHRVLAALQSEREGAAVAAHLLLGERVLRVRLQPGMQHRRHFRMAAQPARDRERVAVMLLHAHGQRLDAAQHQETILRAGAGSHGVLQEPDLLGQRRVSHDGGAADHVGMPVDVLGGGMDHDVHAEIQRPLEIGREEGVVANGNGAVPVCRRGHRFQIHQVHERVGRRFDPRPL